MAKVSLILEVHNQNQIIETQASIGIIFLKYSKTRVQLPNLDKNRGNALQQVLKEAHIRLGLA
jgi:hypothetical protein